MNLARVSFVIWCLWCTAALPARAADVVNVTTNFYNVTGLSVGELRESLRQARPWKTNVFHGITTWGISWNYKYARRDGQFRVTSSDIKADAAVTLPRWVPPAGADRELIARWQAFVTALGRHEDGHVKLAREAALEARRQFSALKEFDSAEALTKAVNQAGNGATDKLRQQEREYDVRTQHGMTQGAHFP